MMRKSILWFLVALIAASCGGDNEAMNPGAKDAVLDSDPKVSYVTTETFEDEVLNSDVPVLVDFTATWCVPCKVVDPVIMSLYPEMHGRAKVFKLDIDEDPEIYERLGVSGVPHILFFKDGVEQDRIVSPQPREIYVQYLESLIDGRSTLDVSLQLIEEDAFRRHFLLSRRAEDLRVALETKPDLLSAPFENGQTPLSAILNRASVRQNDQIELALANGATPTTRDLVGLGRCEEFMDAVESDPETVNRPDPDGASPLYVAITRARRLGDTSCLQVLLDAGVDPSVKPSQKYNVGRMVLVSQDTDLVTELLDRGLDPSLADINGWNMLHWAAYYSYPEMVGLILDHGVDASTTNLEGHSPADLVRRRRDSMAKSIEEGVDAYGREVTGDYADMLKERLAVSERIIGLLEG